MVRLFTIFDQFVIPLIYIKIIVSSDNMLQISKYRVELDVAKKELDNNEKRLKENQDGFNKISTQLNELESVSHK